MKYTFYFVLIFFCGGNLGFSQGEFVIQNKKHSDKIRMQLINNLIIIPVEINGVELSFILDTGVSKPIIFNFLNVSETLQIKNTEKIFLRGLGEGDPVEAHKSKNNIIRIGDAINLNQEIFAVFNANLNFAPRLGIPIHGIIGYDLFKDFVIEINYSLKYIRLTDYRKFKYKKCRKCETLNLEFYNNKPYVNANIKIQENRIPVKLLIDTGGSDALWLFEDEELGLVAMPNNFDDFLGHGLSGSVYGKRSRVDEISLKKFKLKNANAAFPDSTSIIHARKFKGRNGSLAGNILKRFNLIINYRKATITLKKNQYYKDVFHYNKSGIELEHNGIRLISEVAEKIDYANYNSQSNSRVIIDNRRKLLIKPAYTIVELRDGSPAQTAGLLIGDVILSINNKEAHNHTLQEMTQLFFDDVGTKMRMKVDRNGHIVIVRFKLENLFNKKSPLN